MRDSHRENKLLKEKINNLVLIAALNCTDSDVRSKFYSLLYNSRYTDDVNLKLSMVHLILRYTDLQFHEWERFVYEGTVIPNEFKDVGNLPGYTPKELLRLLRVKQVHLEGCLSNLVHNADRTRNITMNYLVAAKDVLEMGSITEVLWNMKQLRADER